MTEQRMPLPADTVETAQIKTQAHCITAETICQFAKLCLEISTLTKTDAFFSYSPHVPQMDVRIYADGWESGRDTTEDRTVYDDDPMSLFRAYVTLSKYRYKGVESLAR